MTYEESFTVELKREINADFKKEIVAFANSCLLYTSDAADEL